METRQVHEANRAAWNQAARHYAQEIEDDVTFLRAGGKNLMAPELRILDDLGSWCRRAIHLQCAGGRDTLSLWNQGAAEIVGVDISDQMIACAQHKSAALGAPATWYCCDLLDTPHELDGTADLVYTGRGAINWIMDLANWAAVAARLLKPGGRLFIFEGHPISSILDPQASELRLDPDPNFGDYFATGLGVSKGWPVEYIAPESMPPLEEQSLKYERHWTLADILNALTAAGLLLERFEEYPDQYWDQLPHLPKTVANKLPHTFSLLMRKPSLSR